MYMMQEDVSLSEFVIKCVLSYDSSKCTLLLKYKCKLYFVKCFKRGYKTDIFFSEYYRDDRTDVMMKVQWRKMPT